MTRNSSIHAGSVTRLLAALLLCVPLVAVGIGCDPNEGCGDINDCAEDEVCAEGICARVGSKSEWGDPCTTPQAVKACYTGPVGTGLVGECKNGLRTCQAGQWGRCVGQTRPIAEVCNGRDDDCDGTVDEG